MSTTINSNTVNNAANSAAVGNNNSTSTSSVNGNAEQDRFLKLLVAQLNNQDPMNPLDNAQMTSQIAQINTVTGIEKLNTTVQSLASQFASQQLMQGTAMVGRQVLVEGNQLTVNTESKQAFGAVELGNSASSVKVQVLDARNKEVGSTELGSLPPGRHNFAWDASGYEGEGPLHFKVTATNGEAAVASTALNIDQVSAVSISNGALQLELARGGTTTQSALKAVL